MTDAARVLGLTQPAVSAQISRLEALVGFRLFEKSGRRLKPSAKGLQFHKEVARAMGMIDRLEQVSETIRTGAAGKLVIASHPSASVSVLPELMAKFSVRHPDALVKMINRTSEGVRSVFEAASVDIGITELPIELAGIELRKYTIECVAIVPSGHPLADKKIIKASDISGLPFVGMDPGRLIGHRLRSAMVDAGAEFNAIAEVEYFSSICGMVAAGLGVSIVDCWSAHTFRSLGLEVRKFEPELKYEIGVFYSSLRPPTRLAEDVLEMLDEKLKTGPVFEEKNDND